jgi:uncharacterized membrane protein YgcG
VYNIKIFYLIMNSNAISKTTVNAPENNTTIVGYAATALVTLLIFVMVYFALCHECEIIETNKTKENYVVYSERDKWRCKECSGLSRIHCGNCANCGYCYNYKGRGECVPGDENGPFFRDDCVDYEYVSPVYHAGLYPTWSYFYDDYYYNPTVGRHIRHHYRHGHDYDHDRDHNRDHNRDHDHNRDRDHDNNKSDSDNNSGHGISPGTMTDKKDTSRMGSSGLLTPSNKNIKEPNINPVYKNPSFRNSSIDGSSFRGTSFKNNSPSPSSSNGSFRGGTAGSSFGGSGGSGSGFRSASSINRTYRQSGFSGSKSSGKK